MLVVVDFTGVEVEELKFYTETLQLLRNVFVWTLHNVKRP